MLGELQQKLGVLKRKIAVKLLRLEESVIEQVFEGYSYVLDCDCTILL